MKILSCFKLVPEEQDIAIGANGDIDTGKAALKISQFDLSAIEAAVQLKQQHADAQVTAVTIGDDSIKQPKIKKDVLSRGPDALLLAAAPQFAQLLPAETAQVLAATIKHSEFDLIICGDGSGDLYAQQVGLLLGETLEVPTINGISKILQVEDGVLHAERELEEEIEVLQIPLPAVISVSADINEPTIPSMKAILGAAKKPATNLALADLQLHLAQPQSTHLEIKAPEKKQRQALIIDGDSDEQLSEFVELVKKSVA